MTVRLLTQSSHMKVSYKEATKEEIEASEKIILKVFRAEDSTLKRTIAVRRGLASAVRSFYIQDSDDPLLSKNFLPVGFLPWLTKFYNDEQIKYEHIEMRKWPKINKEFAKNLIDGKIICKGPEGIAYKPRDYQIRSSIIAAKNKVGNIQLPVGCITGDTIININRKGYGRKITIAQLYKSYNGLNKREMYNFDNNIPTYVRSLIDEHIHLNQINGVMYSGIKDVYKIILENGRELTATSNHKIMTKDGWKKLGKLEIDKDFVMCDTLKAEKKKDVYIKKKYKKITGLKYHPYSIKITSKRDGLIHTIDEHRLVCEANINKIILVDFIDIIKNDEEKAKQLKYLDPKIYDVHHIDMNHRNNDIKNLKVLTKNEHQLLHSEIGKYNFNQGIPTYSLVKSIEYIGKKDTYDISCIKNHNFVANGIIIHNSGKGFILALLCKIYSEHNVLCLFNSIDLVNQTYKNFTYKYGIDPKEIGIIQGQNFQDDRRITIMSVASYEKAFHVFPRIKVILIDEVHELGSGSGPEQATKVLFACQNAPIRIGLSATADAIDNPFRQMALYGNVGPIIYEQTIQEKIEEGSLANIKVKMYNVNCQTIQCSGNWADSYEQTRISTKKFRQQCVNEGKEIFTIDGKEYIREMVARGDESNLFVFNEHRNNMIVEHALENKRVLILYTRREQGEILETKLKKILGENKVKRVDGMDDSKTREEAKEILLENEDNVVLASAMWNTGVDIPWLHTLIIASGGRGTAMIIQRLGRSTRKHDDTNKEYATVIDYIDNFSKISHNQSNKRLSVYRDKLGFDVEII